MKRRVVITGMGIISPIGNTKEEVWKSVEEGTCGIAPITRYDSSKQKVKLAGELKDLDLSRYVSPKAARKMDPYTQYAMYAAAEAMEDAGIKKEAEGEESRDRWGVIMASGIGGIQTIETEKERGQKVGYDRVSPYFIPMAISNMAAGNIAIEYGLKGMCSCTVTACASAGNAIGDAFRHIRDGYGDLMAAGGSEASITPLCIGGFTSLRALSTSEDPSRASIPFDKERSGFVMGEGAAVLILEELGHAKKRGAKIYGEIAGYGSNCDAHHITAPNPEGDGAAKCMAEAMRDAGISPTEVDYVNAHGTSTRMNDSGETKAIHKAFGPHAASLKVSSTKSMTGHLLGASAAAEAVITTLAVQNSFIPPTVGYQVPDEDCDLDYQPNRGESHLIRYALSNSFGFGGHNVSLIFRKFEDGKQVTK